MDSRCYPKYVHLTHRPDQIASLLRDTGPSCSAVTNLPSPVPAKSFSMPTQHR